MSSPTPLPVPPDTRTDARNRAWRTFWQGIASDVLMTGLVTLGAALTSPDFVLSRDYMIGVGALVAKSMITAAISYLARFWKPPAVS